MEEDLKRPGKMWVAGKKESGGSGRAVEEKRIDGRDTWRVRGGLGVNLEEKRSTEKKKNTRCKQGPRTT